LKGKYLMSFAGAKWVWMNGTLLPWKDANIHVSTHALHYGSGVFEGIRCYDTADGPALFRIAEHLERFMNSARTHSLAIPFTPEQIEEAITELICRNGFRACYVRPLCYRGSRELTVNPRRCPVEIAILAWPWKPLHGSHSIQSGIRVCISPWKKFHSSMMPTTAKASGQYVNSILAIDHAVEHGYDEAIFLDVDGYVAEGAAENLFLVRDGALFTNDETNSILLGITRDSVIQIARDLGYTVTIAPLRAADIASADEVFLTGTAAEIVPVCEVDDNKIGSGECGLITRRIQEQFIRIVSGQDAAYRHWLQPVYRASEVRA
jgi:branched-chain amino acid aminotransferase